MIVKLKGRDARRPDGIEDEVTSGRRTGSRWMGAILTAALCAALAATPGSTWAGDDPEEAGQEPAAAEETAPAPPVDEENPPIGGVDLDIIRKATERSWSGFLERWLTPMPVPKKSVVYLEDGYALSHPAVSHKMEVVREEGDTVWLRGLPPEDPESPLHPLWLQRQRNELLTQGIQEWAAEYGEPYFFLDFTADLVPPPFVDGFEFVPSADDLPRRGGWQMNMVVTDMNGDGHADLVHPPTRKGEGRPYVFLGDGDGGFEPWDGQMYSRKVPFDYGAVAVADFDGDGHQDIALAIHFKTQWVMYGDGTGDFTRVVRLPSPDPRISSRAVTPADFDGDGRVDLAFLAELDLDLGTNVRIDDSPTVWIARNGADGWGLLTEGLAGYPVIGDTIRSADFDGNGLPDLVVASNANNYRDLLLLNRPGDPWESAGNRLVLASGYHFDVSPSVEGEGDGEQVVAYATFSQFLKVLGDNQTRTGIIRYVVGDEGFEAPGGPVVVDDQRYNPYYRVVSGDVNGDGLTDLVAGRKGGGLEVYLQLSPGSWYREEAPELATTGRPYDLHLVDVDGDGRDDLLGCFAETDEHAGGVWVWLTRPRS